MRREKGEEIQLQDQYFSWTSRLDCRAARSFAGAIVVGHAPNPSPRRLTQQRMYGARRRLGVFSMYPRARAKFFKQLSFRQFWSYWNDGDATGRFRRRA